MGFDCLIVAGFDLWVVVALLVAVVGFGLSSILSACFVYYFVVLVGCLAWLLDLFDCCYVVYLTEFGCSGLAVTDVVCLFYLLFVYCRVWCFLSCGLVGGCFLFG